MKQGFLLTVEELTVEVLPAMREAHFEDLEALKQKWEEERRWFIHLLMEEKRRLKISALVTFGSLTSFFLVFSYFSFYLWGSPMGVGSLGTALASLIGLIGFYKRLNGNSRFNRHRDFRKRLNANNRFNFKTWITNRYDSDDRLNTNRFKRCMLNS